MFNSMNNTTGIDSIAYSKPRADTVSAVHSLDSYSDIVRNTLGKSNNTPDILRSTVTAEFNARSLEERLKALKDVKKDKLCFISFGRGFYKLQESGKYHFTSAYVMFSLDGKMYYFNYDEDNHPVDFDVFLGYSSSGDSAVMIKIGEKHDYTGEDTRDVRCPEFFASRLAVRRSESNEYVANYFYHAATNQLSCNISNEIPDAGASDLMFKLLANFINRSSDTLK